MHEAQRSVDRMPARPEHFYIGFRVKGNGLSSCNRFEELNKLLLTAYFEAIQGHFPQGGNI